MAHPGNPIVGRDIIGVKAGPLWQQLPKRGASSSAAHHPSSGLSSDTPHFVCSAPGDVNRHPVSTLSALCRFCPMSRRSDVVSQGSKG